MPDGVAVRIGLWGGEELGTIGSRAYVDGLGDEVIAYLNLDMAGSLNGANLVYDEADAAAGSAAITAAYEAWFAERGEPTENGRPGRLVRPLRLHRRRHPDRRPLRRGDRERVRGPARDGRIGW